MESSSSLVVGHVLIHHVQDLAPQRFLQPVGEMPGTSRRTLEAHACRYR